MRTKVTLVLLFLNVALFFYIFKFERGWRTANAQLETRRLVLGPAVADLRSLTIAGAGRPTVQLTRQGDQWSLTQPINWPANPHAVSRLVNALQLLEHETSFSVAELAKSGQTLADYGLAPPRLTVTMTAGDPARPAGPAVGEPVTLGVGDATKDGNRLYLLSPDGMRVHVVDIAFARVLATPVDQLRADNIFTIPIFEARSLSLQTNTNLRVRVRRDGDHWTFETPIAARASTTAVGLAINALGDLRVRQFVPPGNTDISPATNLSLRITIEGNNRSQTLTLGQPVPPPADAAPPTSGPAPAGTTYYAVMEGRDTLFTVTLPAALLHTLRDAQETLRDAHLLFFDPAAVTAIAIRAPDQPEINLQRLESGAPADNASAWQLVHRDANQGPQTQPADTPAVQTLLDNLHQLTARQFLSDAPSDADLETWGFNRPERQVVLSLAQPDGTTGTLTLEIGLASERNHQAYARVASARSVYEVDPAILRDLPVTPLDWRRRLLQKLPDAAVITALKLTDLEDQKSLLDWRRAAGTPPPAGAVSELLAQLRELRARNFVEDGFPPKVNVGGEDRPWRYRLDVTTSLPGGSEVQTDNLSLFFTARVGGTTQLAGSPSFGVVFAVPQPLLDAMWQLTYGPRDPGPPAQMPTREPVAEAPAPTPAPAPATPASSATQP